MKYNQSNYRRVYENKPEEISALVASEEEPSLSEVVQVGGPRPTIVQRIIF